MESLDALWMQATNLPFSFTFKLLKFVWLFKGGIPNKYGQIKRTTYFTNKSRFKNEKWVEMDGIQPFGKGKVR